MASDKVNFPEASAIAQVIKFQIRKGICWSERSSAEQESLDQIATTIARMVSGDGVHWDAIIGYAHAAKPGDDPLKTDRSFDYPYTTPGGVHRETLLAQRANRVGLEAIERSIREIPHRDDDA